MNGGTRTNATLRPREAAAPHPLCPVAMSWRPRSRGPRGAPGSLVVQTCSLPGEEVTRARASTFVAAPGRGPPGEGPCLSQSRRNRKGMLRRERFSQGGSPGGRRRTPMLVSTANNPQRDGGNSCTSTAIAPTSVASNSPRCRVERVHRRDDDCEALSRGAHVRPTPSQPERTRRRAARRSFARGSRRRTTLSLDLSRAALEEGTHLRHLCGPEPSGNRSMRKEAPKACGTWSDPSPAGL